MLLQPRDRTHPADCVRSPEETAVVRSRACRFRRPTRPNGPQHEAEGEVALAYNEVDVQRWVAGGSHNLLRPKPKGRTHRSEAPPRLAEAFERWTIFISACETQPESRSGWIAPGGAKGTRWDHSSSTPIETPKPQPFGLQRVRRPKVKSP